MIFIVGSTDGRNQESTTNQSPQEQEAVTAAQTNKNSLQALKKHNNQSVGPCVVGWQESTTNQSPSEQDAVTSSDEAAVVARKASSSTPDYY